MHVAMRPDVVRFVVLILSMLISIERIMAQAPARKRRPPPRRKQDGDPFKGIFIIPLVFSLIILAPLVVFVYNFSRDPATPTLLTNVKEVIMERTFGFLSNGKKQKKSSGRGRPAPYIGGEDEMDTMDMDTDPDHED
jgi:hypothetical protein